MAVPVRNIGQAAVGQITATPSRVLSRLAIRIMRVKGVPARGRRR
jgi:hypothetical protein